MCRGGWVGVSRVPGSDRKGHHGSAGLRNFSRASNIPGLRIQPGSERRRALDQELLSLNSCLHLDPSCVAPGKSPSLSESPSSPSVDAVGAWETEAVGWGGHVHRPQLWSPLFLRFHVGLSFKGSSGPRSLSPTHSHWASPVLRLWILGSCYKELPAQEDKGRGRIFGYSSVLRWGGGGVIEPPHLWCPGWPQSLQPSSSAQEGQFPPVTARALHAQYCLAHQEPLGCHPRVQAGLPALLPQNR